MSKRRLSHQQSTRINKIQSAYQDVDTTLCHSGLVLTRFSRHAEVEIDGGDRVHCAIRPNIDSLVAGDRVIWQESGEKGVGVVVSRYDRQSVLNRYDTRGQAKPIAANLTQIVIVMAIKPELSWSLLDSYLVMVETLGLKPLIVLNKIDLPQELLMRDLKARYDSLGYDILFTSQHANLGIVDLEAALENQVSVFVGQSGVGKSSLISHILPDELGITTREISTQSELGCHTTRNSRLYHLKGSGALIDSPGVREFKLEHLTRKEIVAGFPEFRNLANRCKYRNCTHTIDAQCAIVEQLKKEPQLKPRYSHMIHFIQNLAVN